MMGGLVVYTGRALQRRIYSMKLTTMTPPRAVKEKVVAYDAMNQTRGIAGSNTIFLFYCLRVDQVFGRAMCL